MTEYIVWVGWSASNQHPSIAWECEPTKPRQPWASKSTYSHIAQNQNEIEYMELKHSLFKWLHKEKASSVVHAYRNRTTANWQLWWKSIGPRWDVKVKWQNTLVYIVWIGGSASNLRPTIAWVCEPTYRDSLEHPYKHRVTFALN